MSRHEDLVEAVAAAAVEYRKACADPETLFVVGPAALFAAVDALEAFGEPGTVPPCSRCGVRPALVDGDCLECEREDPVTELCGDDEVYSPSSRTWHPVIYKSEHATRPVVVLILERAGDRVRLELPATTVFKTRPGKTRRFAKQLFGTGVAVIEDEVQE